MMRKEVTKDAASESEDEDGSDNDEFIVHQDGFEEIHITRKARKQLKSQVAHFRVVKHYNTTTKGHIDEEAFDDDGGPQEQRSVDSSYKSSGAKRMF